MTPSSHLSEILELEITDPEKKEKRADLKTKHTTKQVSEQNTQ